MPKSVGKDFETITKNCVLQVPDASVTRLHDQTTGFSGSCNPCDFIFYKYPYQYCIECKTVNTDRFPLHNLSDNQYKGLMEYSKVKGIIAGVIIWFVQRDITRFYPIEIFEYLKLTGVKKSIRYDEIFDIPIHTSLAIHDIQGKKKRVFFDYDYLEFFTYIENTYNLI
jgi:penicillin-binding protein-related factor A (putative recombinase)